MPSSKHGSAMPHSTLATALLLLLCCTSFCLAGPRDSNETSDKAKTTFKSISSTNESIMKSVGKIICTKPSYEFDSPRIVVSTLDLDGAVTQCSESGKDTMSVSEKKCDKSSGADASGKISEPEKKKITETIVPRIHETITNGILVRRRYTTTTIPPFEKKDLCHNVTVPEEHRTTGVSYTEVVLYVTAKPMLGEEKKEVAVLAEQCPTGEGQPFVIVVNFNPATITKSKTVEYLAVEAVKKSLGMKTCKKGEMCALVKEREEDLGFQLSSTLKPLRIVTSTLDLDDDKKYCPEKDIKTGAWRHDFRGKDIYCYPNRTNPLNAFTDEKKKMITEKILPELIKMHAAGPLVHRLNGPLIVPRVSRATLNGRNRECAMFNIPESHHTTGVENADVVIYVAAGPSKFRRGSQIAWATPCATAGGRAAVIVMNFNPANILDEESAVYAASEVLSQALGTSRCPQWNALLLADIYTRHKPVTTCVAVKCTNESNVLVRNHLDEEWQECATGKFLSATHGYGPIMCPTYDAVCTKEEVPTPTPAAEKSAAAPEAKEIPKPSETAKADEKPVTETKSAAVPKTENTPVQKTESNVAESIIEEQNIFMNDDEVKWYRQERIVPKGDGSTPTVTAAATLLLALMAAMAAVA